ncbi:MAG: hypothetical protein IKC63_01835, partial [Clostridia bacterium]|nr:hypothetical protein [Clostridia bacterium]
ERMTVNHDVAGSSPAGGAKKKDRFQTVFFLSNPKDWYGITAQSAVYGIRRKATAWHHAIACIFLRIDSIQGLRLDFIPQQVADFIHAYRRDFIELHFCTTNPNKESPRQSPRAFSCFFLSWVQVSGI